MQRDGLTKKDKNSIVIGMPKAIAVSDLVIIIEDNFA